MIPSDQGFVLGRTLNSYIAQGGSRHDAATVATVLNSATTITDLLVTLPGSRMNVVPVSDGIWSVVDRAGTEVLTFRLTEEPRGAKVEIIERAKPHFVNGAKVEISEGPR